MQNGYWDRIRTVSGPDEEESLPILNDIFVHIHNVLSPKAERIRGRL